jgi:hypothetical protein
VTETDKPVQLARLSIQSVRTGRKFGNHVDVQWPRTRHWSEI